MDDYRNNYNENKKNVLTILRDAWCLYSTEGVGEVEKANDIARLIDETEHNTFSIVVVGQFSAGKSTFLNAMMGEKYLPSFSQETTANINFLKSKKESPTGKELIRINYADGTSKTESNVSLENIEKYVSTKGDDVANKISNVELFLDSKFLNDGVTLVDSPGLNGVKEKLADITGSQINSSHAAIFMFTAKQPGSKTDYQILKRLKDRYQNVFIILNQIDLINEGENETADEIVNNTLIKHYAEQFPGDTLPEIFPISAYEALVSRSKQDLKFARREKHTAEEKALYLKESRIEDFEERLLRFLTNGEKTKQELLSPIHRIQKFLEGTKKRLEEDIDDLNNSRSADEVREQIGELQTEIDNLTVELTNSKSDIDNGIRKILDDAEEKIKKRTKIINDEIIAKILNQSEMVELQNNSEAYLKNIQRENIEIIDDALKEADIRYQDIIRNQFTVYANQVEDKLNKYKSNDTNNTKVEIDKSIFESTFDVNCYIQEQKRLKQVIENAKNDEEKSEYEAFEAKRKELERQRLEGLIEAKENIDVIKRFGQRPEPQQISGTRSEKRVRYKHDWIIIGKWGKEEYYEDVPYNYPDDTAGRKYDELVNNARAENNRKIEELKAKLAKLNGDSSAMAEFEVKKAKRQIEEANAELEKSIQQFKDAKEKAEKEQLSKVKSALESYVENISAETRKNVIDKIENRRKELLETALDVIMMGLNNSLNSKREQLEIKQKELDSSVEEKENKIKEKNDYLAIIEQNMKNVNSEVEKLSNIKIDEIKRA